MSAKLKDVLHSIYINGNGLIEAMADNLNTFGNTGHNFSFEIKFAYY